MNIANFPIIAAILAISFQIHTPSAFANGYCGIELKEFEIVEHAMSSAGKSEKLKKLLNQKKLIESRKPAYSISFKKLAWSNKSGKTVGTGYMFKIRDLDTGKIVSESNSYLRLVRDQYTIKDKLLKNSAARKMFQAIRGLKNCNSLMREKERRK